MARPTRAAQIAALLPSMYGQDPLLRRLVEAIAGRLADAQFDSHEVMNAHWVDTADHAPVGIRQPLADLPRIAALVALTPLPDEEATVQTAETVLVDGETVLSGPSDEPLAFADLVLGQRLFVGGTRRPNGTIRAVRVSVAALEPTQAFEVALSGRLFRRVEATAVDPVARLLLLAGPAAAELFRARLKLTVEAFLEGAGTPPAILKMVAATMGWGPLQGSFAEWSSGWVATEPVFEARARDAPDVIRLRELPLRRAETTRPQRVKAGARWLETNASSFVVRPTVSFRALDLPIVIPTLVNLDSRVTISTLVVLETVRLEGQDLVQQDVSLRLAAEDDGTLRGTLIERRRPPGEVRLTDVSDRIRVRTSALRVDQPGAAAFLGGGTENRAAALTIADGARAIRLTARGEGIWGNAVRVANADEEGVELSYDPALAVAKPPSPPDRVYVETLTLPNLAAGRSRLVTAEDFSFTIPQGESRWLYTDHVGWALFGFGQWDRTVFDDPPEGDEGLEALARDYPAKGIFDHAAFGAAVFPQEFLRAFRYDQPDSVYDDAFFNASAEQVEVLLGWQEGQRATIRIDLPVESMRDRERLAALPDMVQSVKAAGIKVILAPRSLVEETQPLGEREPIVRPRSRTAQPLGERLTVGIGRGETHDLEVRVIGVFDRDRFEAVHFD